MRKTKTLMVMVFSTWIETKRTSFGTKVIDFVIRVVELCVRN
jgi:hypothetical protein